MDPTNFNDSTIENIVSAFVQYVYDLMKETVHRDSSLAFQEKEMSVSSSKKQIIDEQDTKEDDDDDDAFNALFKQVQSQQTEENKTEKNFEAFIDSKRTKLMENIKVQIEEYIRYCKALSIEEFLEEYGNDDYRLDKKKGKINEKKLVRYEDALYANTYFDLGMWWNVYGKNNFAYLVPGAAIMLGKPTHNAFQERVFSWGTYADGNLKKRMKESNFEMAVLNALNAKNMEVLVRCMKYEVEDDSSVHHQVSRFFDEDVNKRNGVVVTIEDIEDKVGSVSVSYKDGEESVTVEDDVEDVESVDTYFEEFGLEYDDGGGKPTAVERIEIDDDNDDDDSEDLLGDEKKV